MLSGETGHHAARVLRLKVGEEITLADERGGLFRGRVTAVLEGEVEAELLEDLPSVEPPLTVTLLQGLPKGDKMDLIVEKCTELGVKRIIPLLTERVVVRLDEEAALRKRERWQRVARAAAQQSRRGHIPAVELPRTLEEALGVIPAETLLLILWEGERSCGLKGALGRASPGQPVALIVGPEGGLSKKEVELACKAGGIPVHLGPRILRTETAGLTCLAIVMYELGDLGRLF
ncbi:MAG: 16S rRNA (uracil(1498)-N(3))-methyltransferase [Thermanaeromonas sp.]|nr:16S rRNA (uracil(1498)-N(3))-methyltransferase [Thermanaeromonas sp.]